MGLTASRRATTGIAVVVMVVGFSVVLLGVIQRDLARSLGGACLAVPALNFIVLITIKVAIADTREERRILAAATREAQAERSTYIAAKAALENEQGRLTRDMAAERARIRAKLIADRQALAAEFEEKRNQLVEEAMTTAITLYLKSKRGEHTKAPARGAIIQFPTQQGEPQPEHARSRGHGVAGP